MLGIAIAKHTRANGTTDRFVFLYYTQSNSAIPLGNYVYRYELVDNKLINPDLILKLPASPGPIHDGGKVLIGPDNRFCHADTIHIFHMKIETKVLRLYRLFCA